MVTVARGVALFLGVFTGLNLAAELLHPAYAANLWWIDLRVLPHLLQVLLFAFGAIALLDFGCTYAPAVASTERTRWTRIATRIGILPLFVASVVNAVVFYRLLTERAIRSAFPLPFSLFIALALLLILQATRRTEPVSRTAVVVITLACAVAFPLLQTLCFGLTDYRRSSDVGVVLGARVHADGTLSLPLAQRTATAATLYREGLVRSIIVSGGAGDGPIDEPEAMTRYLAELGVPRSVVVKDSAGVNTEATVANTLRAVQRTRPSLAPHILVVSHFYHLPRIKLTYRRYGYDVVTVPARIGRFTPDLIYNTAREIPALWLYYLRALT